MPTSWSIRTKPSTTWSNIWRTVRFKDYLVGEFTDNIFYNITDEDWNRIVIYDSSWFEKVDSTDWDIRAKI